MENFWKILIADDDKEIHDLTHFLFASRDYKGKKISFSDTYSADETKEIFTKKSGIAVCILDVVMESKDSGLKIIRYIREELGIKTTRIILRTAHPDIKPLENVVTQYDIDDYFIKGQDPSARLVSSVFAAIRRYELIDRLDNANKELQEQRDLYKNLIHYAPDAIITVSKEDFFINDVNHKALEMFDCGFEEIIGISFEDLNGERKKKLSDVLFNAFEDKISIEKEWCFKTLAGHTLYGEMRLVKIPKREDRLGSKLIRVSIIDRTEVVEARKIKKRQDELLFQADKLKSLSQVSAGLAHEMSQPLMGISIVSENLKNKALKNQIDYPYIIKKSGLLIENTKKMKQLIEHVRTFSSEQGVDTKTVFDVNESVLSALELIQTQYKNYKILIKKILSPTALYVSGNRYRLEQVILNLLSNSFYALKGKKNRSGIDRSIMISTVKKSKYATLTLSDNGTGIREKDQDKIFDPFFTTKPVGEGTGLGLSVSYGIVREMKGQIKISSRFKEGTSASIRLPLCDNLEHHPEKDEKPAESITGDVNER